MGVNLLGMGILKLAFSGYDSVMNRRTPSLMLQGTSSDAGKSLLTAALCRIFTQDGLQVAPFKSQNMALNSCVTPDGLEMGRAQALQAAACRRQPDVRMNPVLLKPTSDMGSQVIVMGRPVGVMRVREYWDFKPQAFEEACIAYDSLASENDLMLLEGAGSPAEINLREHDIVNMAVAHYAQAPVLLVGDIDRGGVFASLVGTLALLDDRDRSRIAGMIINKFRGDASLLPPALTAVSERTGKPFLGIVPWVENLNLPDEDSVSFKAGLAHGGPREERTLFDIDVAVLDLPRISNFTDMDALSVEPDVRLRVVRQVEELGCPDLLILPGSKNTLADLQFLRIRGFDKRIHELVSKKLTSVLGICGGLQMLGQSLHDPLYLEGGGSAPGLGLLDLETTLEAEKTLCRVRAKCLSEGLEVDGYEIHHGLTRATSDTTTAWIEGADGKVLGWTRHEDGVSGSYTHGLFDNDCFRRAFLDSLRQRKGLKALGTLTVYSLEPALDRLADAVRGAVDCAALYRLAGL